LLRATEVLRRTRCLLSNASDWSRHCLIDAASIGGTDRETFPAIGDNPSSHGAELRKVGAEHSATRRLGDTFAASEGAYRARQAGHCGSLKNKQALRGPLKLRLARNSHGTGWRYAGQHGCSPCHRSRPRPPPARTNSWAASRGAGGKATAAAMVPVPAYE
jgi:hypothetical protein